MPLYEYACRRCGAESTHLMRSVDAAAPRCPECDSPRMRRLISRVRVITGARSDDSVLRSRPRDFLERPERFGEAMRVMSERTGVRLSGEQVDGAMHRLSEAKKKSS